VRSRRATVLFLTIPPPLQTTTDRASEAIKAAEIIFADEMGATLGLTPAKRGPGRKEPAAIQAVADAEARARFG
jgi:hypothetical protein